MIQTSNDTLTMIAHNRAIRRENPLTHSRQLSDLGLDSLDLFELAVEIDRHDVTVPLDLAEQTWGDLETLWARCLSVSAHLPKP